MLRRERNSRAEFDIRVGKLKNSKAAVKDEITGDIIKNARFSGGGQYLEAM